jgi:hypothetical protein
VRVARFVTAEVRFDGVEPGGLGGLNGVVQGVVVLDLAVNFASERGLLGDRPTPGLSDRSCVERAPISTEVRQCMGPRVMESS